MIGTAENIGRIGECERIMSNLECALLALVSIECVYCHLLGLFLVEEQKVEWLPLCGLLYRM
jgi:hypothetical protein